MNSSQLSAIWSRAVPSLPEQARLLDDAERRRGPRTHAALGRCLADTIDVRWIVLAKSYLLAALGWT
jgi:hypothetical protein